MKGYFAGQYHRRGRQLGRVLATQYEEVVVDRLFAGNVQLIKALQPLVEMAEVTLQLDEAKRARTLLRVDAGAGTLDDLNWLLSRGDEVVAKKYSGRGFAAWWRRSLSGSRTWPGPNACLDG